jgi:predicted TIM-barrel fold metal-dependent hydrolase
MAATQAIVQACSLDERRKLLAGNARRVWRLEA